MDVSRRSADEVPGEEGVFAAQATAQDKDGGTVVDGITYALDDNGSITYNHGAHGKRPGRWQGGFWTSGAIGVECGGWRIGHAPGRVDARRLSPWWIQNC